MNKKSKKYITRKEALKNIGRYAAHPSWGLS